MKLFRGAVLAALSGLLVSSAVASPSALTSAPPAPPVPVEVVIRDQRHHLIHKQMVAANGVFETERLEGGTYTVLFKARGPALKGAQYALFLASGRNKVTEDALAGERLDGPGVAMNIVVPRTCNIVGQVANGQTTSRHKIVFKVKIVNGRRYVWQPPGVSSNIPGRWIEDGIADAYNIQRYNPEWLRRFQEHGAGPMMGH